MTESVSNGMNSVTKHHILKKDKDKKKTKTKKRKTAVTEWILGGDGGFRLQWLAVTVLVLSDDPELVLVTFLQLGHLALGALDIGHLLPFAFVHVKLLHSVTTAITDAHATVNLGLVLWA